MLRTEHSSPLTGQPITHNNKRKRIKNLSKSWKLNGGVEENKSSINNNNVSTQKKNLLPNKFRPRQHGFNSLADKMTVKIVEERSNKSLGTLVCRCGTSLSYLRSILSEGEVPDTTGFLFVDSREEAIDRVTGEHGPNVIDEARENKTVVGLWVEKRGALPKLVESSSAPLLPPIGGAIKNPKAVPGSGSENGSSGASDGNTDENGKNDSLSNGEEKPETPTAAEEESAAKQKQSFQQHTEEPNTEQHRVGGFTSAELDSVVTFMDPNCDGEISFAELSEAFRRSRRSKADEKIQAKGREMLLRINSIIKEKVSILKSRSRFFTLTTQQLTSSLHFTEFFTSIFLLPTETLCGRVVFFDGLLRRLRGRRWKDHDCRAPQRLAFIKYCRPERGQGTLAFHRK